jgi:hypothetical protein
MRILAIAAGTLITIAGIIWMLQGMGSSLAPQSFMTNAQEWIVIGAFTAVAGTALVVWAVRRPH